MRKLLYLLILLFAISCSDNAPVNNCFNGINMNAIIDLTLPEFQGLLVPSGQSQNTIQGRNVFLFRVGNNYKAFDQQCPEKTCNSLMTFNGLEIICLCDNKKYSFLSDGAPLNGEGCHALMYLVSPINSSQLRISR